MTLAKYGMAVEGWLVILPAGALAAWLIVGSMPLLAVLPVAVISVALLKFRDPPRAVPADPLGVISPVDGCVTSVERDDDSFRLVFRVAWFAPYILRSPTEGKVLESGRAAGRHGMRIRTDEDEEVELRLYGLSWLPPASIIDYGERVGQGQRYGVLRSANRAELWVPADADIVIRAGDAVVAGETVVARFHRNGEPVRPA